MFPKPSELPGGFSGEVRLFPLPDLVCFPYTVHPLHIFESRYREMMEDTIRGDQLLCMATLEPGYQTDYYSRPPISPYVCVGRVATHKCREDGTYDLLLVGLWRARIESEIWPVRSYRRAKVQVLNEQMIPVQSVTESPQGDLVRRLVGQLRSARELIEVFADEEMPFNGLVDVLACHLPFDRQTKLTLLAETDPIKRAHLIIDKATHVAQRPGHRSAQDGETGTTSPFSDN